jgi:hypothetical protein
MRRQCGTTPVSATAQHDGGMRTSMTAPRSQQARLRKVEGDYLELSPAPRNRARLTAALAGGLVPYFARRQDALSPARYARAKATMGPLVWRNSALNSVRGLRSALTADPGGRIDPGTVRWLDAHRRIISREPRPPMRLSSPPGPTPLTLFLSCTAISLPPWQPRLRTSAFLVLLAQGPGGGWYYSERCCGMPASRARTSVSRYRR